MQTVGRERASMACLLAAPAVPAGKAMQVCSTPCPLQARPAAPGTAGRSGPRAKPRRSWRTAASRSAGRRWPRRHACRPLSVGDEGKGGGRQQGGGGGSEMRQRSNTCARPFACRPTLPCLTPPRSAQRTSSIEHLGLGQNMRAPSPTATSASICLRRRAGCAGRALSRSSHRLQPRPAPRSTRSAHASRLARRACCPASAPCPAWPAPPPSAPARTQPPRWAPAGVATARQPGRAMSPRHHSCRRMRIMPARASTLALAATMPRLARSPCSRAGGRARGRLGPPPCRSRTHAGRAGRRRACRPLQGRG